MIRYQQAVVPYNEVEQLRIDAFHEGWDDGYRNGMAGWTVIGCICLVVGFLIGVML